MPPTPGLVLLVALVLFIVLKFAPRWFFRRMKLSEEYLRKRQSEEELHEEADWFGQTGLDEAVERELPRYLRRELHEFVDEPTGLKASDLRYLGVHSDSRGTAHFWKMPPRSGEVAYAYVQLDEHGTVSHLGWGDWAPVNGTL